MEKNNINLNEKNNDVINTGINNLDVLLGGLRGGELMVLASRPEVDKSTFALNVMNNVVMAESLPSLFISTDLVNMVIEMKLCIIGGDGTFEMIHELGDYSDNLFYIEDYLKRYASIEDLFDVIRRHVKDHDVKFVIIDQLKAIAFRCPLKYDQLTKGLKELAVELDITVMMLINIGKEIVYKNGRTPKLKDFKKCSFYVDNADVLMTLTKDGYRNVIHTNDGPYDVDLTILKNCHGKTGDAKISWFPGILSFFDRVENVSDDNDDSDKSIKSLDSRATDLFMGFRRIEIDNQKDRS